MRGLQGAIRSALLVSALLFHWLVASAAAAPLTKSGEIIVKFKAGASQGAINRILADLRAVPIHRFGRIGVEHHRISGAMTVPQAIARYRNDPAVEFIEPNYIVSIIRTPNDPRFPELWGLHNTGQTGGLPGADISATEGWDTSTGSRDVIVGIIDTGIDYTHPDLAGNIYINAGEIPGNGIDDDGNGFEDDVHGWDFINQDNDPMDDHGHGTHVAGTVGAIGDNGIGVTGVNWNVRLMPLKFLSSGGSGTTADAIAAIQYATQMGVNVMSNSWGGGGYSDALRLAIQDANDAGILFVAAAGNASSNNDVFPTYPAGYDVPNVIAVAATDEVDQLAGFSNYGPTSVDLAAPGTNILSTLPFASYGLLSGTSMATPHVSGALALILSRFPAITLAGAKGLLLNSVDPLPTLNGMVLSGGRLNVAKALEGPDSIAPNPIVDLAALGAGSNSIPLQWTATGDDTSSGTVSEYDIRYATFEITEANFDAATPSGSRPEPHPAGSQEQAVVTGLAFSTTYYFAIKSRDEYGNRSPISNVVSAATLGPPDIDVSPPTLTAALLTGGTVTRTLTLRNLAAGTLDFLLDIATASPGGGAGPGGPPPPGIPGDSLGGGSGPLQWADYVRTAATDSMAGPLYPAGAVTTTTLPDVITDPSGDGGLVDLTVLRGLGDRGTLQVEMEFSTLINRFNFGGFLSLDIDQNRATGLPPSYGNGAQDIGAEYEFQFFNLSSGFVSLYNVVLGSFVGSFPIEIGARTLRFSAPLDLIGHDDGIMDVTGVIGDSFGPTDWFPNSGHGTILSVQWLSVEPSVGTVPPGGSVDVQVTFDASGLFGGAYDASIRVASNDPDEAEVLVPAHLDVTGAPDIALSTTALNYGTVFLGSSRLATVVVSNAGTDLLTVTGVTASPGDYSVDPGGFSLAPGASRDVVVTFSPQTAAPIDGSLTITSDDPDEGVVTVTLHGEGLVPPDIGVTPTSLSADLFSGESTSRPLTIRNTGGSDLTFTVSQQAAALAAATAASLRTDGQVSAALTANSSVMTGVATPRPGASSPAARDVAVASQNSILAGNEILVLTTTSITGSLRRALEELGHSYDFILTDDFTGIDFTPYRTIVVGMDGGLISKASCQALATAAAGGRLLFMVGGTNIASYYDGVQTYLLSHTGEFGWTTSAPPHLSVQDASDVLATGLPPTYTFVEPGASYYMLRINDPDARVAVKNGDNHPALVHKSIGAGTLVYFINGASDYFWANPPDFAILKQIVQNALTLGSVRWLSVEPNEGTVPAGGSVDVQVTFDASGLFGGAYDASIRVSSNDPDEAEVLVPAHLGVTGAPDIALSTTALNYGTVFLGSSRPATVVVSNAGTDLLTVTGVTASPGDYSVDPGGFSLAPGASRDVVVTFSPQTAAPIDGSLTITSDDPDEGVVTVTLHGEGLVPPDIGVDPSMFAAALRTGETESQVLTVHNTGGSDLTFGIRTARTLASVAVGSPVSLPSSLRGPTLNRTHPDAALPSVQAEYQGTYLRFGLTAYGEIMPFQFPVGTEHLAVGTYLAGYTVAYVSGGVDHVSYSLQFDRAGIVPVSYRELEDTPSRVSVEVVTRTVDGVLGIRRVFTFPRARKHVEVTTEVQNLSPGTVTQVVFKEDADWDVDNDFEDDSWDYDRPRNMIYAWDQHYVAVGAAQAPDLMDINGWNDVARRATTVEIPVGPVFGFDGLEVLHFELGTLEPSETRPVKLAYGAGANLAELQQEMDEAIGAVSWLSVNPATGVVPAGGSADLAVTFDPGTLSTGDYAAQIVVENNDPDESQVALPATLHVTGIPNLVVSPASLDFGSPFLGQVVTRTLQFANLGTGLLEVTSVTPGLPDFAVNPAEFALEPLQSLAVTVTFSPTTAGLRNSSLTIASNDPDPSTPIELLAAAIAPPVLTVSPASIHEVLSPDETRSETLTIGNAGESDLLFTLRARLGASAVSVSSHPPLAKGEEDPRVGNPVTLGSGGPDLFGYSWIDSDQTGGPAFGWVDIASLGTAIPISGDDQTSAPIPIGFPFRFYGADFTSFRVCTNGFLSFTSSSAAYFNDLLPSLYAPENMVAAFWDDLYFGSSSYAYYYNDGARMIVQFNSVFHLSGGGPYTFEIILYPTGTILYQYLSMAPPLNSATVGIQNGDRSDGLTAVFNNYFIHDNHAIRFAAGPTWLTVSPTNGTVPPGGAQTLDAFIDARGLPGGDYAASIDLTSNDPVTPVKSVPVTMHLVGIPVISVHPTSLEFAPVFVGQTSSQTLVVENTGTDSLRVTGIASDEGSYSANPTEFTLAPRTSQIVTVAFAPSSLGIKNGTLSIAHNAEGSPTIVSLSGSAVLPPTLTHSPDSIRVSLNPGAVRTETVTIGNAGGGDLQFLLEARSVGAAVSVNSDPPLAKGEEDRRVGAPVVLGSGGPDQFGHQWIDSDSPGGPTFNWVSLAGIGTVIPITGDEAISAPIPIGFPFRYFGTEFTSVRVCSNGYLTFTSPLASFANNPLPSTASPENLLAAFWDDLYLDTFSHVIYYSNGATFIVQFDAVYRAGGGGPYTFEVILQSTGAIVYQYLSMSPPLTSATIGIQNATRDDGLTAVFDNNYVHGNLAIRFATGLSWLGLNPTDGTVPGGGALPVRVFLNTTGLLPGDHLGVIGVYSNDPATPSMTIPVTLHVNGDDPPIVSAPGTASGSEGVPLALGVTASDPEGDAMYSLTAAPLPEGASFVANATNSAGELRWTPDFDQAGTFAVTISATSARHANPVSGPADPLEGSATIQLAIANTDRAPVVTAPGAQTVAEGVLLTFPVIAADPDGDPVATLEVGEIPLGATYTPDPALPRGTFAWTPTFENAGDYSVTFTASNVLSGSATTTIRVTDQNRPPVANTGGPYTGVLGVPIVFDGSNSFDPDGQPLEFTWDFGDGDSGSGPEPSHTYASATGSPFAVTLTVFDGTLSGTATTTTTLQSVFAAHVFFPSDRNYIFPQIRRAWVQIEPINGSFLISDVLVSSVTMSYNGASILSRCKSLVDHDQNHNGVAEIKVCFTRDDLRTLFAGLPNGTSDVEVTLEGDLLSGGKFRGTVMVRVIKSGYLAAGSLALVSPNPLNPQATLDFVTTEPGTVSAQLFDLSGRLVRTLLPQQYFMPGAHEVTVDGRNEQGNRLASGVYYYRLLSVDGISKGAITVLK